MRLRLAVLLAAVAALPTRGLAQLSQTAPQSAPVVAAGSTRARTLADHLGDEIKARNFGSCVWDGAHDVAPCIQAAIAAAAARGGGNVLLPVGSWPVASTLTISTSGVGLRGATEGTGGPRDTFSPYHWLPVTALVWTGAAGGTMLDVEPASASAQSLYSIDIKGIVFEAGNVADICVKIAQVSNSHWEFGVSEPRKIGAYLTTTTTNDAPGTQFNDIAINARSTSNTYAPTGILLDAAPGSNWNVSYNHIRRLNAWYNLGDGIVIGNSDNNEIEDIGTGSYPVTATGTPVVFAVPGYVMPNGMPGATISPGYTTHVKHLGATVTVQGYIAGAAWSVGGTNAGSAALHPVTLTTTGTTAFLSSTLAFASTAALVPGMGVSCGGPASGVQNHNSVSTVGGTTVGLFQPTVGTVAAGVACTFGYGATPGATPGAYVITATDATHFSITAPPGGHSQTALTLTSGVLVGTDIVVPFAGTPAAGDTWTLALPAAPHSILIDDVDRANSVPTPYYGIGATGSVILTDNQFPLQVAPNKGIVIGYTQNGCNGAGQPGAGPNAVTIGDCGGIGASGTYATTVNGVGAAASGWGATTVGGHNAAAAGTYAFIGGGDQLFAGGYASRAGGAFATDRNDSADVWANGTFAAPGDAQVRFAVERASLAGTSAVRLTTNGAAAGPSNGLGIPANTVANVIVEGITCTDTTNRANWASWDRLQGTLARGGGTPPAYAGGGSAATTPARAGGSGTTATASIGADTTNNQVSVSVSWPNSNATHCAAAVRLLEVQ
jgi:hypothetical protein